MYGLNEIIAMNKPKPEPVAEPVHNVNHNLRSSKYYRDMTPFEATMYAEGVYTADCDEEVYAAWQILVDTGMAWTLQGWFGRTASALLEQYLILEGDIEAYTETRYEGSK